MMNDYDDNDELGEIPNYHFGFIHTSTSMTMTMMTEGDVGVEDKAIEDRRQLDRWFAHGSQRRAAMLQYCNAVVFAILQYCSVCNTACGIMRFNAETLDYCSGAIW